MTAPDQALKSGRGRTDPYRVAPSGDESLPRGRFVLPACCGDRELGAILVSSLLKFVVILAIIGVLGHDGFSVARTQVTVRDDAAQAAQIAHDALGKRQTPTQAYQQALAYLQLRGGNIPKGGFQVAANNAVTLTVTQTAPTYAAGRFSAFDSYVRPSVTVTASNGTY